MASSVEGPALFRQATPPSNPAGKDTWREIDSTNALIEDWIWDPSLGGTGRWKSQQIYSTSTPFLLYNAATGISQTQERNDIRGAEVLIEGFAIRGIAASTHTASDCFSFQMFRGTPGTNTNLGSTVNTAGFNPASVRVAKSNFSPQLVSDMFFGFVCTKLGNAGNLTGLCCFYYRQIRG